MGVSKEEVVVHLAMLSTVCWVVEVELLPELDTAVAMFGELVTAGAGDLVWVLEDTVGLVAASEVTAILETAELVAAEELSEAVVLAGEVAVELVAALRA